MIPHPWHARRWNVTNERVFALANTQETASYDPATDALSMARHLGTYRPNTTRRKLLAIPPDLGA